MKKITNEINGMKLYKVIPKDGMAQNGRGFDYKPYFPKNNKAGKWTPKENAIKCDSGYHITNYWNMWVNSEDDLIFEVECRNVVKENIVGVNNKFVCESIRLIKQIEFRFDENRNTGHSNTGNRNTGDWNTGYRNTGDSNTGYSNTGDRNTGNWNTGHKNTGNWNMCSNETGVFNTVSSNTIRAFNRKINKSIWYNCKKPSFLYFDLIGDYKESFIKSFNNTTKEDVKLLLKLPNFNYDVFEEISGISKEMIDKKLKNG